MADETKTQAPEGAAAAAAAAAAANTQGNAQQRASGAADQKGFAIHTQYIKDFSFENPNAPGIYLAMKQSPQIQVNLDVKAARLNEQMFEILLSVHVEAKAKTEPKADAEGEAAQPGERTAFMVELQYGALVSAGKELTDQQRELLLLIEVPRYLFPFAREVIATATRDGGFPPLLINPVDFSRLYQERRQRAQQAAQQNGGAAPEASAQQPAGSGNA